MAIDKDKLDLGAILSFVSEEKVKIEDATNQIRLDLKRARRNYEGKFDVPIDSVTKKRKMFVPLTKQEVNAIAPRFDMDPESISVQTNEPGLERKAVIWEELLKSQFKKMKWKERMKEEMIPFVNEGTVIIEMFWNYDKDSGKDELDFMTHDVKDVFIFPKERSLMHASAFAIRRRMLLEHFKADKRYMNRDDVRGRELVADLSSTDTMKTLKYEVGRPDFRTELDFVELYERHGFFPRSFLSGTPADTGLVDGILTVANVEDGGVVVEVSEEKRRDNFIEAWYYKRPYLWYGGGVGIDLRDYQFYYNKLVNRRDNNEDVLHHGMFVKRRGMNVDARQRVTGAGIWIEADNPAELTQLRTTDITQGSYVGESNLLANVQRLNGTAEVIRGSGTSRSASEAAIKDRNAGSRLADPQGYLNRLFKLAVERAMELDREFMDKETVVKMTGRDAELAAFDDFKLRTVNKARAEEGLPPVSPEEFKAAMATFGKDRFMKVPNMKFLEGDFEVDIDLDSSLIRNKSGLSQFIVEAIQLAAQVPGIPQTIDFADLFEKVMNLNGLKVKRIENPQGGTAPPQAGGVSDQGPGNANEDAIKQMLTQQGAPRADMTAPV